MESIPLIYKKYANGRMQDKLCIITAEELKVIILYTPDF